MKGTIIMTHRTAFVATLLAGAALPGVAHAGNTDLIGSLSSETFVNTSVHGSATFDSNAQTKGTVKTQTATISYKSDTQAWTLSTSSGLITFGPGDVDASLSNAAQVAYVKRNGSTTDSLTITRGSTSGRFTYRYVGSAFWQHSQIGSNGGSGTIDAFAFGVATPVTAVPIMGAAYYDVDLLGSETTGGGPFNLLGQGTAAVDFGKGALFVKGTLRPAYFPEGPFSATAKLTSGQNSFSGTIAFNDGPNFNGTLTGKFFGPTANEIGASWSASASDGRIALGTITGRKSVPQGNASFTDGLKGPQLFNATEQIITFDSQYGATNNDTPGTFANIKAAKGPVTIVYDPVTRSYAFSDPTLVTPGYGGVIDNYYGQFLHEPLTYVDAATMVRSTDGVPGAALKYRVSTAVYGMSTLAAAVPRIGTGNYSVTFGGRAADHDYKNFMWVGGAGLVKADFVTGKLLLTGNVIYGEDWIMSGRSPEQANGQIKGSALLSATANSFAGGVTLDGLGAYKGRRDGSFFGPKAEEIGATFTAVDGTDRIVGTMIGKNGATVPPVATFPTLGGLKTETTFKAPAVRDFELGVHGFKYDPVSHIYTYGGVNNQQQKISFGPTDVVGTKSDASRKWYSHIVPGQAGVYGYLFRSGIKNPVIALTYTSFADIKTGNGIADPIYGPRQLFTFGVETPAAQMPTTGSAVYSGIVRGIASIAKENWSGDVTGISKLNANFGASTLNLAIDIQSVGDNRRDLGHHTFYAVIDGSTGYGAMYLQFYGPKAAEFGAAWAIRDNTGTGQLEAAGIAVGKRN